MPKATLLECSLCKQTYDAGQVANLCSCGGPLLVRYDLSTVRHRWLRRDVPHGPSNMWRYAPVLPVSKPAAMISLGEGMTPILPAFAGYVPKAFADNHPEARIYRMRSWEGFRETYWLDPADPLFMKLAERFLSLYEAIYGGGRYYLADSFNEMLPPMPAAGDETPKAASKKKKTTRRR